MKDLPHILDTHGEKFNPGYLPTGIDHGLEGRHITIPDLQWMAHNLRPSFMEYWPFGDTTVSPWDDDLTTAGDRSPFEAMTREQLFIELQHVVVSSFAYVFFLDGGCWDKLQVAHSIQWSQILDRANQKGLHHYTKNELAAMVSIAWDCWDNYC